MLRKIKRKTFELTLFLIGIFIIVLVLFGTINMYQSSTIINKQANSNLDFLTYSVRKSINSYFRNGENKTEDCRELIELTINNDKFNKIAPIAYKYNQYNIPYITNYLNKNVKPILLYSIKNTAGLESSNGLESIYFMFDPKVLIRKDLIGLWYVKSKGSFKPVDNGLSSTMFPETRSDLEWFYLPKKTRQGVWSKPYIDSDLNIPMVTYSTPVFSNKTFIGVTGIDLSIADLEQYLSKFKIFKTGKIYLINQNNRVIFAKGYNMDESTLKIDKNLYMFLKNSIKNGKINLNQNKINIVKSTKNDLFSIVPIYNGFVLVIYVPSVELYGDVNKLVIFTSFTLLLAIVISMFIAFRTYSKMKKINNELMHKEKLISMGKMAAEIVHEINNPLGYLNCNIDMLKKFLMKLKNFMLYCKDGFDKASEGEVSLEQHIENINKFKDESKIDYIIDSLEETIDESKEGIQKVSILVQNLKNFAKDDSQDNKNNENLQQIIENTLIILGKKISDDITISKHFEEISPIYCNKNQMEQVLINIIENACFSVRENGSPNKVIEISLYKKDKNAYIEIEDNGIGIEENVMHKIFDAFFTTKKQGMGTGLGLSIAYEIVTNKHNGEISVKSKKNKGTKFTIKLPYEKVI